MTNIAEILENAPKGLKLYSLTCGHVTLVNADTDENITYQIQVTDAYDNDFDFTKNGFYLSNYDDAECVLFPSKEHKSWDNWQEVLFQYGDVVTCTKDINQKDKTFIITGIGGNFIALNNNKNLSHNNTSLLYRYATPEEREQFFKELNDNGYTWNDDTKQIEKSLQTNTSKHDCLGCVNTRTKEKPFTIDDFKPFDKVLVRDTNSESWYCNLFSHFNKNASYCKYECIFGNWVQCIPYNDETKHLIGTDDDCPNKYKTW